MELNDYGAECPYCNHVNEIEIGDNFNPTREHRHDCVKCGMGFIWYIEQTYHFCSFRPEIKDDA